MTGIGKPQFDLVDHYGAQVTEASYNNLALMVYFGFTNCKVVCPRSLGRLSNVLESLPEDLIGKVKPLYITVDPERDTPEVMRAYLEKNYPLFTGLCGSPGQVDAAKKAFKVFAKKKINADNPEEYDVPHSAIIYLISPDGVYLTHWVDTKTDAEIIRDLNSLL